MKIHDTVIAEFVERFKVPSKKAKDGKKTYAFSGNDINNLLDYYAYKEYCNNNKVLKAVANELATLKFQSSNNNYEYFKRYMEFQEKRFKKFQK